MVYKKHYPPTLHDEVWRLDRIAKDGALHKKLIKAEIITVMDFLRVLVRDPQRLRNILETGMTSSMWENTVEHAKTCVFNRGLYVYYEEGTNSVGAVFNDTYDLRGLVTDGQYFPLELLTHNQKISADSLVKKARENWNEVVEFDGKVLNSFLFGKNGTRALAAAISDHNHVATTKNKQQCITPEPRPQSRTKNHNPSNSRLIEFPSIRSNSMGGMVLNTPQAALAGTMDYGSVGMSAFGGSCLPGECSMPRDRHGYQDFYEEIQLRSSEMLESDDMQRLPKTFSTRVGAGMGAAFGHSNEACYSYNVPYEQLNWTYGQERGRSSRRAVVRWLKLKAVARWIFVRKRTAYRRAQFFYNVPHEQLNWTYGLGRGCSSRRAVVRWVKLKAVAKWIFVRKRAAYRRAQFVELDLIDHLGAF